MATASTAKRPYASSSKQHSSRHSPNEAHRILSRLKIDVYKTLGVDKSSTAAEIKTKYYQLCRQLHPDTLDHTIDAKTKVPACLGISEMQWLALDAEAKRKALREQFVAVQDAYEVLSDAALRKTYDTMQRTCGGGSSRPGAYSDVWARERPTVNRKWQTEEEKINEKRIKFGIIGFSIVFAIVLGYQKLVQHEDLLRIGGIEHFRSVKVLSRARERAMEKWREVPPEHAMEYESRRLHQAQNMHMEMTDEDAAMRAGEYHRIWPYGSGLGLIALLRDEQLCGVGSRSRVAMDPGMPAARVAAQKALERDRIVRRYYSAAHSPSAGSSSALPALPAPAPAHGSEPDQGHV
ncbi:mdj1 protein precursor [Coemansia sp. IMI 203386]|nr:mdj1 protein precursor [Coemansia sp. IMI 203386]